MDHKRIRSILTSSTRDLGFAQKVLTPPTAVTVKTQSSGKRSVPKRYSVGSVTLIGPLDDRGPTLPRFGTDVLSLRSEF